MNGRTVGYIRVCEFDVQKECYCDGVNFDKKFTEYTSFKSKDRPYLKEMMDYVKNGDSLFIYSFDMLAGNVADLKKIINYLLEKGVKVKFTKEDIELDIKDPMTSFFLKIIGNLSDFEIGYFRERQREGVELAKKMHKYRGGTKKLNDKDIEYIISKIKIKTKKSIADHLGVSYVTLNKYIKEYNII